MERSDMRQRFDRKGYITLTGVIDPDAVRFYVDRMTDLAGAFRRSWTQPDGVCRNPDFWPLIHNERILDAVRTILGPDIRFLQHNDLHVGFSSPGWHRDSVNRTWGVGPDWDERESPYRLVRVGIYMQRYEVSHFRLGLIPGSHRPDKHLSPEAHRAIERRSSTLAGLVARVTRRDPLAGMADWFAPDPGDCVIFDPRVIHTGSDFEGTKYAAFIGYGVPNCHYHHHRHYYTHLRPDLGYQPLDPVLVARLQAAGLYGGDTAAEGAIEGAWVPGAAYNYLAKRFKS